MASDSVKAVPMKSFDTAVLSANYQRINVGGLAEACFQIILTNNSTSLVTVSYDGVIDNEILPPNTTVLGVKSLASQTNAQPAAYKALWNKGKEIWVKGNSGSGFVYLSGYYV